jgi:hypothetical protein
MNRSEFLALMVSPLILPFVKKEKNFDKYILGHRHVIEYPNGARTHLYSSMTETTWYDKKGNNDGFVSGAVLMNKGKI